MEIAKARLNYYPFHVGPLAHLAPHSMDNNTVNEVFDALEKGRIKP